MIVDSAEEMRRARKQRRRRKLPMMMRTAVHARMTSLLLIGTPLPR